MQLNKEETQEALSRMYIVRIFSFLRLRSLSKQSPLRLQHKRLQLDDLLTNRKHIIQCKSHKKLAEEEEEIKKHKKTEKQRKIS